MYDTAQTLVIIGAKIYTVFLTTLALASSLVGVLVNLPSFGFIGY
jgi:hypothetical protein